MNIKKFTVSQRLRHQKESLIARANNLPLGHPVNLKKLETVFAHFENVFNLLENNEDIFVDAQSEPVSIVSDGTWFKIRPNFTHMCDAFENISKDIAVKNEFIAIRQLIAILGSDEEIMESLIRAAREEIIIMRNLASVLTPNQLATYIDTIRTRLEFERLGIVKSIT